MKKKIKALWFALKIAYSLATKDKRCMIIIEIKRPELRKLLTNNTYEVAIKHHNLHPYIVERIIKMVSSSVDDVDHICNKATFEAAASELVNKNKK
jgi:hypothetical protein